MKTIHRMLWLLLLISVLDIISSYIAITYFEAQELFYLSRKLIEFSWLGLTGAKIFVLFIFAISINYVVIRDERYYKTAYRLIIGVQIIYLTAVVWNTLGIVVQLCL